jgi:hypothetical protein
MILNFSDALKFQINTKGDSPGKWIRAVINPDKSSRRDRIVSRLFGHIRCIGGILGVIIAVVAEEIDILCIDIKPDGAKRAVFNPLLR